MVAVTPMLAALIAALIPCSVLLLESIVMLLVPPAVETKLIVVAVPLPMAAELLAWPAVTRFCD